MKLSVLDISLLIGYAAICIGIGFWSSRGHKDEDYLIAGRKMTLFGFVSSVVASYVGGAAIVAYSAYVYQFGISAIAVFAGTAIGFLVFIPYALKLRKISGEKEFLTLSDWFYYKFDNRTGIVSAFILFVVYFGMLLNQFIAGSSILSHISGLSYEVALLISSAIISIYLVVGGFKSVVKTDIFQYIVLFVLFVLLSYVLVADDEFFTLELVDVSRMDPLMTIVFIAFGILIIFQSAEYWQRVYAAKNNAVVKKGLIGSAIFVVVTGFAITIVGLSAHLHVPGIEARNAFAEGLTFLIPAKYIGAGLILLFAAIMSSADTIIFVLASSLSKDYIAQFSKKEVTQKNLKKQTQIFIILFSVLGFFFAYFFRDLVAVIIFITGIGFTLIPAAIASFHFKIDKRAALASFIAGIVYILILFITNNLIPELSIASILVAAVVLILVQVFIRKTKMRNKYIILFLLIFFSASSIILASEENNSDSTKTNKEEKIKKGFNFGGLPVLGYNTDIGFQYGLILNVFNYGDGTYYPDYKYTIYAEVSRTTLGSGINQIFFDSKHLLPNQIRITSDLSYLTERILNFYGFNGYDAVYHPAFENDSDQEYISRVFYRHERKFIRFTLDLQGKMFSKKILWLAGMGYFKTDVASVDIDRINKGKDESKILPDTALLYDNYVNWGIIQEDEKNGGKTPYLKAGVVFDTRDNEPNPMKGIWSEILFFYAPKILGNTTHTYLKLAIVHRQYLTLVKDKLSFVYRLGYQGTLAGNTPFYMQPYMITSFSKVTSTDGLGGAKTLRGILRNRIVGDGVVYGNFEVRWKFFKTVLWKQNIYLALNAFADGGAVVSKIKSNINSDQLPEDSYNYFAPGTEASHWSVGGGFRIAMNQNFIIAADYGIALDKRDGKDGIYIGIGYLF